MIQNSPKHLQKLTAYNFWANKRIDFMLKDLEEEKFSREICSSFPSIKTTVLHIWDAETIWQLRLKDESLMDWPSKNFSGAKEDLLSGFLNSSAAFYELTKNISPEKSNDLIRYRNIKGDKFSTSAGDIIVHCINHSTFHRGQIITLLRQVGKTDLISTDYITYSRE